MREDINSAGSIYIHIPFCRNRCNYCDFYSTRYNENSHLVEDYLEALIRELKKHREFTKKWIETIYIGGGTPSTIPIKFIKRFLDSLLKNVELSSNYEFTFELNPESVKIGLLRLLKGYGINRISLGIQSLNDKILRLLNRVHNVDKVYSALKDIINCGYTNLSIDILVGTTEDINQWIDDISKLIFEFPIKHISAYILTIDKKTRNNAMKKFIEIEEDIIVKQYKRLHTFLNRRGFIHYEISNYALKGFESKHNLNYWKNGLYLGLGASASSYIIDKAQKRIRYKNISSINKYIRQTRERKIEFEEYETIDNHKLANEIIMLGLRMREGFSLNSVKSLMSSDEFETLIRKMDGFQKEGLIRIKNNKISPTLKGFILNNMVIRELMV